MSKLGNVRVEAEGVLAANRRGVNLKAGANITITPADDDANDILDITIASAAAGGSIVVRYDSGADVGTQPRLNFIPGANITLTVLNDAVNSEVDITIAGPAAAESVWLDQFFPTMTPNTHKGAYATTIMPKELDTTVYHTFLIPDDITTITTAEVIVMPDASGDLRWQCDTEGSACGEDFQTNQDSIGATVTNVAEDERECIDITAAFTGFTAGDLVGLQFIRTGINVADTVDGAIHYLGVLIQGTV